MTQAVRQGIYEVVDFKALDATTGEFEAIVAVFGNVDAIGDRVVEGAFTKTLAQWRSSGDPIPIIWSHNWGDPYAHIGSADPDQVEELKGRGLKVRGRIDLDNPVAAQVYRLLKGRRVKQFSFGYEVRQEHRAKDGANDLIELGLLEVGPTLRGMNPSTELLSVKSQLEAAAPASTKTPPWHIEDDNADCDGFAVVADETGDVVGCHTTEAAAKRHMAALYANVEDADKAADAGGKMYGTLAGSVEEQQRRIHDALRESFGGEKVWLWIVATYADRVVYAKEDADQATEYFEVDYQLAGDTVTFDAPRSVELTTTVRAKAGRRISRATETELRGVIEDGERMLTRMRALLDTTAGSDDDDDDGKAEPVGNSKEDTAGNATELSTEHLDLVTRIAEGETRFR
jgi:HK97 family phage prohead protease